MPLNALRRAVFLDRDGTINSEKDYLHRLEDLEFIPGSVAAIRRLNEAGLLVVVVTNQSGVARGYFGEDQVVALHRHLQQQLAQQGAHVDGFYYCPHHPREGVGRYRVDCNCRKGRPGMLLRAAEEMGIDLSRSFMVGDKLADVEAGNAAGSRTLLVLTGYGAEEVRRLRDAETKVAADLEAAVAWILERFAAGDEKEKSTEIEEN